MQARDAALSSPPQGLRERVAKLQAEKEYCSTREAADLLSLAPGTVQKMVEKGSLEAWRTEGGHRRISVASLVQLVDGKGPKAAPTIRGVGEVVLNIVVVGSDHAKVSAIRKRIIDWGFPVAITEANNAIRAGMTIGAREPHLTILVEPLKDYPPAAFFEHAAELDGARNCDFVFLTEDQHRVSTQLLSRGLVGAAFTLPDQLGDLRAFAQARFAQLIREARKQASESA